MSLRAWSNARNLACVSKKQKRRQKISIQPPMTDKFIGSVCSANGYSMASLSYWFLSPSVILALIGKLKGFDRTKPTPAIDWQSATLDVVVPAKNEEETLALCLSSLLEQDFPIHKVIVVDDGSTDRTAEVVRRFRALTGSTIELAIRKQSIGKTPTVRKECQASGSDALLVLDGDTVLSGRTYISRLMEELFKNAGVASVCGEVVPLTRRRRRQMAEANPSVKSIQAEFALDANGRTGLQALWEFFTIVYRTPLYVFLQRVIYDGQIKMFGSRLNPTGCAVIYRTDRLRECFEQCNPGIGDNLSYSEDIYIGHFFNWKGWRNVQVTAVRCQSTEPPLPRLPRQMYLWSSAFLQALYYFRDLPLSPFKRLRNAAPFRSKPSGSSGSSADNGRSIQEQYRAPWGEGYTRRFGRKVGLIDLISMLEKISYPIIVIYLAIFSPKFFLLTVLLEAVLSTASVALVADQGQRWSSAGMMLAATPMRLLSVLVDLAAAMQYAVDLATGNREWRK